MYGHKLRTALTATSRPPEDWELKRMAKLEQGESIEIEGRKGRWYFLSRHNDIYSCTCVNFVRKREPLGERSCKHIDKFRDDRDDEEYIMEAKRIAKMGAAGQRIPARTGIGKGASQNSHPQMIVDPAEIEKTIERLSYFGRLWLDTEVADWKSGCGRLSLIQILSEDSSGEPEDALLLDVLHYPDLIELFISSIMMNASIEKVFHNAAYDRQYLGQDGAVGVECTLEVARYLAGRCTLLPTSLSLKSLAEHFGLTMTLNKTEQKSDWSVRPLSYEQIEYAIMDVVHLRAIHLRLIEIAEDL